MKSLLCLLSLLASACVLLWVPVWLSVSIPSAFTELLSDRQSLIHAGCLSQEHRKICWHPAQSLGPWDSKLLTQAPIVKPLGHLCTLLAGVGGWGGACETLKSKSGRERAPPLSDVTQAWSAQSGFSEVSHRRTRATS